MSQDARLVAGTLVAARLVAGRFRSQEYLSPAFANFGGTILGGERLFDGVDQFLERKRLGQECELFAICREMFLKRVFGVT
jgi:hypothetical protein